MKKFLRRLFEGRSLGDVISWSIAPILIVIGLVIGARIAITEEANTANQTSVQNLGGSR